MRLIPLGAHARLALPAALMRLTTLVLAGVAVVPASSSSASSTAVASVFALGAMTKAPVVDGPELLAVIGAVVVHIAEGAEPATALG